MGKQRTLKLYLDNTFDEKARKFEANKIKDGKGDVEFEPICVFSERKPRRAFYRGARRLCLFVDGHVKALHFGAVTDELQTAWSKKESQEFVDTEIAKAHAKLKPLKMWQFALIMVLLIAILLMQLNAGGVIRIGR